MQKTTKNLLAKILVVLSVIFCVFALSLGAIGCANEEESKVITDVKVNGTTIVVTYSDGTTANLPIDVEDGKDGSDASACAHANKQAVNHAEIKVGTKDACTLDIMMCDDCGSVVFDKVAHDATQVKDVTEEATCYAGSYTGKKCLYCEWTEGERKDDALNHAKAVVVENPLEFQAKVEGKNKIIPCKETWYKEVKLCPDCGYIDITTENALGHSFDKTKLTPNLITNGVTSNDTFTLTGECTVCKEEVAVVTLPKLADYAYTIANGGSLNTSAHNISYKYTGTYELKDSNKFTDGTTVYEFTDYVITAEGFTAPHYILKNVEGGTAKYNIEGTIKDWADGSYNKLYLNTGVTAATVSCKEEPATANATAICEFCTTAVPVKVMKAHTGVTIKDYSAFDGTDKPCEATHNETWNCTVCGDFTQSVAKRTHNQVLTASSKLVDNNDGTFDVTTACEYCGTAGALDNITLDASSVRATCGKDGLLKYTPAGSTTTYELVEKATKLHVYEAGKVVEYVEHDALDNVVDYEVAKAYFGKSVILSSDNPTLVCGGTNKASLICPVCNTSTAIVIVREHLVDTAHSVMAEANCEGTSQNKLYCFYGDCDNKYVDGTTDRPYSDGYINARHKYEFVEVVEGDTLSIKVKCSVATCGDELTLTVAGNELKIIDQESGMLCDDYADGKKNFIKYQFKATVASFEAETYTVKQEFAEAEAHAYGVTKWAQEGDAVVYPSDDNYQQVMAHAIIGSGSPAQDCKTTADYSFICPLCTTSVAIKVAGSHVNTDGQVTAATCEKGEFWTCDADECGEEILTGVKALGHDVTYSLNVAETEVTFTCSRCTLTGATGIKISSCKKGDDVNCEDSNYTYTYTYADKVNTQDFAFVAKNTAGVAHKFLGVTENNTTPTKLIYVVVDGKAVQYDATNSAHASLEKFEGMFCTVCKEILPYQAPNA